MIFLFAVYLLLFLCALRLVTEREKALVANRQYNTLLSEQQIRDAEMDRKVGDKGSL